MKEKTYDPGEIRPRKWLLVFLIILEIAIFIVLANKVIMMNKERVNNSKSSIKTTIQDKINDINKEVESAEKKHSVFSFNMGYSNGTKNGISLGWDLDSAIDSNKQNKDHLISVKYNDVTTSDVEEIKKIKKSLDDWTNYEESLDYDEDGYINLITIED